MTTKSIVTENRSQHNLGEHPNTTWQCPECGKFTSDRTAETQHGECFKAAEIYEIMELRAWVDGW